MRRNSLDIYPDIQIRQTMKKSPSKFIRMCAWLDHDTDWSVDEENDRQSEEKKSVPRRRARRIKLNWDPDGDKGENDAARASNYYHIF